MKEPLPRPRSVPGQEPIALSFPQLEVWRLAGRSQAQNSTYNLQLGLRIRGKLDAELLKKVLAEIVRRHETLRTVFHLVDGEPVQVILPESEIPLAITERRDVPETEAQWEAELPRLAAEAAEAPFVLSTGPLARANLLEMGPGNQFLFITIHHIVIDVWGIEIFRRELESLYNAFLQGKPSPLPEPQIRYADFARAQQRMLTPEALAKRLEYWKKWLAKEPPPLVLPTGHPRPSEETFVCHTEPFHLGPEMTGKLMALGRESNASLFTTMMTAFGLLICRWSGQPEIIVGFPVANRRQEGMESVMGVFTQGRLVRLNTRGAPSFRELLAQAREANLRARAHQDLLPARYFLNRLQPERDLRKHSPHRVLLNLLLDNPIKTFRLGEATVTSADLYNKIRQDLNLNFRKEESPGQTGQIALEGMWRYKTELFEAKTIAGVGQAFLALLEGIVADPDRSLDGY